MTHTRTQQIKNAFQDYSHSHNYNLFDCYERPSRNKEEAMEYCKRLMHEYSGKALKIIGYNTMTFSVGFLGTVNGRAAFIYITKTYDRYIYMDEMEV